MHICEPVQLNVVAKQVMGKSIKTNKQKKKNPSKSDRNVRGKAEEMKAQTIKQLDSLNTGFICLFSLMFGSLIF